MIRIGWTSTAVALASMVPAPAAAAEAPTPGGGSLAALLTIASATVLALVLLLGPSLIAAARALVETHAKKRLKRRLESASHDVLHDFILPGAYGGLARVDHALLIGGHVVCVLYRSYGGAILGEPEDAQWVRKDGARPRRFLNPLIQNEGRAEALRKVVPETPVLSLVVFDDDARLVESLPDNVIRARELESWLAGIRAGEAGSENGESAWQRLRDAALTDKDTRKDLDAQLSFG